MYYNISHGNVTTEVWNINDYNIITEIMKLLESKS